MSDVGLALGVLLELTTSEAGGRRTPILNHPDRLFGYRPNWGLPSMLPPEQTGAPVLGLSRNTVAPGESVHAVIVAAFPEMVPVWDLEAVPGVSLPMYEGPRVCGTGHVLWRVEIGLPPSEEDVNRLRAWLRDPAGRPPA